MMNKMVNNDKGFTLIELMIVIAIIGILAAIAIPQFAAYRNRAYLAALKSDVHSLANAQEAYYADAHNTYAQSSADLLGATYGAEKSANTVIAAMSGTANTFSFHLTDSVHGVGVTYISDQGGIQ